jgi:hypothetical protein
MAEKKLASKRWLNMQQLIEEKVVPWSKDTIKRRIESDGFPAVKDVGGYLFDLDDVARWMHQRKTNVGQ